MKFYAGLNFKLQFGFIRCRQLSPKGKFYRLSRLHSGRQALGRGEGAKGKKRIQATLTDL